MIIRGSLPRAHTKVRMRTERRECFAYWRHHTRPRLHDFSLPTVDSFMFRNEMKSVKVGYSLELPKDRFFYDINNVSNL